jgi:hypothetical protein
MSKTVDELFAYKILYMLVTPFDKTDAFKHGIIDKEGTPLKKSKDLTTSEEKDSYTSLHRLVFSLKRLLAKVPGGKSHLASLVAAYWLIKESHGKRTTIREDEFIGLIDLIEEKKLTLVEEEIDIENFITMMEDGGGAAVIVNTTGGATATDKPAVRLNKKGKPISGILGAPNYMYRRKKSTQVGQV